MELTIERHQGLLLLIRDRATEAPYFSLFLALSVLCLSTRIYTGLRTSITRDAHVDGDKMVSLVPYWTPWFGHLFSFATRLHQFLTDTKDLSKDGVFGIMMAGSKQNVVTAPSVVKQILSAHAPVEQREFIYYFMNKVWGDRGAIRTMDKDVVFGSVHRALFQLNRDPFVSSAIATTVKALESKTFDLVAFNSSPVDQSLWERSACVAVPSANLAEASMFPLIRDFVGDIACRILMGNNFMENNPDILSDLWVTDSKINLFLLGIPSWTPGTGLIQARAARERLNAAVAEHHEALYAVMDGRDPGPRWDDLSDVSNVMIERAKEWRQANASRDAYGPGDATVVWAMMVNANQVIFWLLWHAYSSDSLLAEIRTEIAAFVQIVYPEKIDLPIQAPPTLTIDMDGLLKQCPLLQATFLETMRVYASSMSVKKIEKDFAVTESVEDARIQGKQQPQSFILPRGEMVWLPHGVHQKDERYWPDANRFDPRRFFVTDESLATEEKEVDCESTEERVKVDYKTMKVWGGGPTMCKGQKFAEREVILFSAAILTMWDMRPAGKEGWKHPGSRTGAGTAVPKRDIRVRMTRRV